MIFSTQAPPTTTDTTLTLTITGMHCTSCSMNIDDALEEIVGVRSSKTSYARAVTEVTFDPSRVTREQIAQVIQGLGYRVA